MSPGLQAALDVYGCGGRIDPAGGNKGECGEQPKTRQGEARPVEQRAEEGLARWIAGRPGWGFSHKSG